ncbi:unnamed protein product [Leptosia nina]|uniref:Myeloid differentiation primary response protein MyD88 n=1 Tax=Leptosia nina TaxID=320188 RepID=A0AAV1JWD1_9NEOP
MLRQDYDVSHTEAFWMGTYTQIHNDSVRSTESGIWCVIISDILTPNVVQSNRSHLERHLLNFAATIARRRGAVPRGALRCRVLPCLCPDQIKRHRDWRGLASLANISTEIAASIKEYNDKTRRVLDVWIQRNDGTATVSRLFEILQWIDRYDVYDDLLELTRNNQLLIKSVNTVQVNGTPVYGPTDEDLITFEDKQLGSPQRYHAYVLYAKQDHKFAQDLITRMTDKGFRMCSEENLLPGHTTRFAAVARLMSERCRYIIPVCSPDFVASPANTFFTNLAQADGIQKRELKIIPVQYRPSELPPNIRHYHSLRYTEDTPMLFDFWRKLEQSLENFDLPRLTHSSSSRHSAINIAEMSSQASNCFTPTKQTHFLALPSVPRESASLTDLPSISVAEPFTDTRLQTDTKSLSSVTSEKKKKSGTFSKIFNKFKGKKHKKEIMVAN